MKVLLFTLEYPPFKGGVSKYYENLVKYWPSEKDIFILNNNDGKLISVGWPFLKWLPGVFELKKLIKKEKIDHVIVGQILPLGTAALIVNRIFKISYSVILHGMDLTLAIKSGRKSWLAKKILKNASHIICASNFTAELARRFVGKKTTEKIKVVNPGVDNFTAHSSQLTAHLKEKYNLKDKIVLFSIGRLVKRKGFDKVIEVMPEILKEVPNLVYVIGGVGPDEEYLKESANKNAPLIKGDRGIIFLGKISDEEKWAWFDLCDIFTMPSRQINDDFEGFGIVYLEASLMGKPVIAGRSGGVEDAVLNNETGLLVDSDDTKQIADAIIKLAKDENLRKKLGESGIKRAINEFDWKEQINKIFITINNI